MAGVPTHNKSMALLSALENVALTLFTIQVSHVVLHFYYHIM
jgi:hypothetical protein